MIRIPVHVTTKKIKKSKFYKQAVYESKVYSLDRWYPVKKDEYGCVEEWCRFVDLFIEDTDIREIEHDLDVDIMVESGLDSLSDREREIVIERCFFHKTLEDIGNSFGITRERVRQIEAKALKKMKYYITSKFEYKLKESLQPSI